MQSKPSFESYWTLNYSAGGGPMTARVSQRLGALLGWILNHCGFRPNGITLLAMLTSLFAAYMFAAGGLDVITTLWCLFFYQVAYGLDCADGQVARATGMGSPFGAWLDVSADAVSVVALGFSLLYLCFTHGWATAFSQLVIMSLVIGRILHLYSVPAVSASQSKQKVIHPWQSGGVKILLWLIIDTPVFLLMICLLRQWPALLISFCGMMSLAYTLAAVNNAWRLRTPT